MKLKRNRKEKIKDSSRCKFIFASKREALLETKKRLAKYELRLERLHRPVTNSERCQLRTYKEEFLNAQSAIDVDKVKSPEDIFAVTAMTDFNWADKVIINADI